MKLTILSLCLIAPALATPPAQAAKPAASPTVRKEEACVQKYKNGKKIGRDCSAAKADAAPGELGIKDDDELTDLNGRPVDKHARPGDKNKKGASEPADTSDERDPYGD